MTKRHKETICVLRIELADSFDGFVFVCVEQNWKKKYGDEPFTIIGTLNASTLQTINDYENE